MINVKQHNFGKDEKLFYIYFDIMTISISLEMIHGRKHKLQQSYFPKEMS